MYVGLRDGITVGVEEGDAVGRGVSAPAMYVGDAEGVHDGDAVARKEGRGVGALAS